METSSSRKGNPNLLCPKTLEKLCKEKISRCPDLDRKLYKAYPHNLDYKYNFECYVIGMFSIIKRRHIRDAQSFERWFRKLVTEKMNLILENKKNLEAMILIAESLENKMLKFKKIYGIVLEVYYQNMGLLLCLRNMR